MASTPVPAHKAPMRDQQQELQAQLAAFQLGDAGRAARAPIASRAPLALPDPPSSLPPMTSDGPQAGFSFGTCPSQVLGTPRAELGPFEYPAAGADAGENSGAHSAMVAVPSPSHSARSSFSSQRAALPLGETHRRGSIIARPTVSDRMHDGGAPYAVAVPEYRRSSTTGNIHSLPATGSRPSILHSTTIPSATVPLAVAPVPVSPTSATGGTGPRPPPSSTTPPVTPSGALYSPMLASRRGSLMFQPKTIPAPIPPSLLARRSSIPASQLYAGLPIDQLPPPPADALLQLQLQRKRASVSSYPAPPGFTTTTHALYQRRASMVSDGGESSGTSTHTVMGDPAGVAFALGDNQGRRASMRYGDAKGVAESSDLGRRRMSLPHTHALHAVQPLASSRLAGGGADDSPRRRGSLVPVSDTDREAEPSRQTQSATSSPRSRASRLASADRRSAGRTSVDRSRTSFTSSLSSSEESAEEDLAGAAAGSAEDEGTTSEIESLPTPGSVAAASVPPGGPFVGFSDPWAKATDSTRERTSVAPAQVWGGDSTAEWAEAQRRQNRVSARGRPSLETIPSDSTTRGADDA